MRKLFAAALVLLTAWTTATADDDTVVVDGVVYTWSGARSAYLATGWDRETPIVDLRIRATVNEMDVAGVADNAFNFSAQDGYYDDRPPIETLVIDDGVATIGLNAFVDCVDLKRATLPATVTAIGDAAFFRCSSLKVLSLPEGLERIEEEAFAECSALETVVVPSTVRYIGSQAFLHCDGVTDAHFLMEASALPHFDWWDGVVEHNGGTEFKTPSGTTIHVPRGLRQDYIDSGKFSAWLSAIDEDDGVYPLWWIVNYGTVGKAYTVSDNLSAVYADVDGLLYCKDDNRWLTPDATRDGEVDYMATTSLLDNRGKVYDQSNWVALSGIASPASVAGHTVTGGTVTGTLLDKVNPAIAVSSTPTMGGVAPYVPNTYIPASVMGRTQHSPDGNTYAFVRPKPQEVARYEWTVYGGDDKFYLPAPDREHNPSAIKGGFKVSYDLYENPPVPTLVVGDGTYPFMAVTRRAAAPDAAVPAPRARGISPYVDGGLATGYGIFPLDLPDTPVTDIATVGRDGPGTAGRYNLLGQPVSAGYRGIVVERGRKLLVR